MCARVTEVFFAQGHANVQATHKTTLEFTKDMRLLETGDCIIAVAAEKAVSDLRPEFKASLRNDNAKLSILIEAGEASEQINARGSSQLSLTHPTEMVLRKSDYISSRTLAIRADKAARDLSRDLIEKLKDPKQKVKITLTVSF